MATEMTETGTMETEVSPSTQSKRNRLQFSLRTFLVVSILGGLLFGYVRSVLEQAKQKRALASALSGFDTYYTTQAQFLEGWKEDYFVFREIYPDPWHNISMIDRATIARLGQVDLTDLNYLSLSLNDELENEDLRFLKRISNLQKLNLRGTEISDDAIVHLLKVKSLKELDIRDTEISSGGLARLEAELPGCQILF